MKPVFGNKVKTCNIISLIRKSSVITSEKALAKISNDFFVNIVENLGIDTSDTNSLTSTIEKYKHHPSITAIKNHMNKIKKYNFSFKEIIKPFLFKGIKKTLTLQENFTI